MKSLFFVLILIPQLFLFAFQNDSIQYNESENGSARINDNSKNFAITVGIGGCHQKIDGSNQIKNIYGICSYLSIESFFTKSNSWALGLNHFFYKHFNDKTLIENSGNLMSIVLKYNFGNIDNNNYVISIYFGGLPIPPLGIDAGLDFSYRLKGDLFLKSGIRYISNMAGFMSVKPLFGIDYSPTILTLGLSYIL